MKIYRVVFTQSEVREFRRKFPHSGYRVPVRKIKIYLNATGDVLKISPRMPLSEALEGLIKIARQYQRTGVSSNPPRRARARAGRVPVNAHSVATGEGFPFVRGSGRPDATGKVWLSRFTRHSDGKGPAIYVGFSRLGRVVIERDNPSRTKSARGARASRRLRESRKQRRSRSDAQALYHIERGRRRAGYPESAAARARRGNPPASSRRQPQILDVLGNAITEGAVVQGFGLHNAGRHYTVLKVSRTRILLEPHLGGKTFWTHARYYRVSSRGNPKRRSRPARARKVTPKRRHRRNPITPTATELEGASKTFQLWHDFKPSGTRRISAHQLPRVLVQLGEVRSIVYDSDKWEGERHSYEHKFKAPRPLLCTGPDRRGLFLVGGRARVTDRGLVD